MWCWFRCALFPLHHNPMSSAMTIKLHNTFTVVQHEDFKRTYLIVGGVFSIYFWGILIHRMVPEWEGWCHRPFTVSITHRESNLRWFSCLLCLFPLTPKSHSTWQSLAGLVLRALPIKSEFLVLTITECSLIGDCSIVGGSRHNILGSYLNINLFLMSVTVNWQYKH